MLNYKIYSDNGEISFLKPIIVFLHGFGGNSSIWLKQIKPLRKKYDLLFIDLPSHGKNNIKLSEIDISFECITSKILEVLDYLQIKKANFLGCSLGTIFIKYIILTKKEIVDKFILIGCVGTFKNWFNFAIEMAKMLLNILPTKFCCKIVATLLIPNKESIESRLLFLECAKRIPKKEFKVWLKLISKFPKINKEYISKIKNFKNGLYIMGDKDIIFLPTIEKEKTLIENIKILKNCGHVCNIDKYNEVNNIILNFIN